MTEKYFFDTDCLSAFLWVREESILIEAMNAGIITEADGNTIWSDMIRKHRMLPTTTFSEYLVNYRKPSPLTNIRDL